MNIFVCLQQLLHMTFLIYDHHANCVAEEHAGQQTTAVKAFLWFINEETFKNGDLLQRGMAQ